MFSAEESLLMDKEFRTGVFSSVLAAGLIVALTMLAIMEQQPGRPLMPFTLEASIAGSASPQN